MNKIIKLKRIEKYFRNRKVLTVSELIVCEAVYSLIFVCGTLLLLRPGTWREYFYFYLFFSSGNAIIMGNEELEYEIRSDQFTHLTLWLKSAFRIYFARFFSYFLWSSLIYVLSMAMMSQLYFPAGFSLRFLGGMGITIIVHLAVSFGLYAFMLRLTVRFQRISVMLEFIYTVLLFYSGLVFPGNPIFSYKNVLEYFLMG